MKNILLIGLGGTVSCTLGSKGLVPTKSPEYFLKEIPSLNKMANIKTVQLLKRTIVYPSDWIMISEYILKEMDAYDGIIITLGTDSLAYFSSILPFLLGNIKKPVILTGAMVPLCYPKSDARKNIIDSVFFATKNRPGVFTIFNGKVILGTRTSKIKSTSTDAFESINAPPFAIIKKNIIKYSKNIPPKKITPEIGSELDTNVVSVILNPQTTPEYLKSLASYDGIILMSYGDGNISDNLIPVILKLIKMKKVVVIASQCTHGETEHKYSGGKTVVEAGAISSKDMTKETCLAKLMWCLGKTKNISEVKKIMHTSYYGELSE